MNASNSEILNDHQSASEILATNAYIEEILNYATAADATATVTSQHREQPNISVNETNAYIDELYDNAFTLHVRTIQERIIKRRTVQNAGNAFQGIVQFASSANRNIDTAAATKINSRMHENKDYHLYLSFMDGFHAVHPDTPYEVDGGRIEIYNRPVKLAKNTNIRKSQANIEAFVQLDSKMWTNHRYPSAFICYELRPIRVGNPEKMLPLRHDDTMNCVIKAIRDFLTTQKRGSQGLTPLRQCTLDRLDAHYKNNGGCRMQDLNAIETDLKIKITVDDCAGGAIYDSKKYKHCSHVKLIAHNGHA